MRQASNVTAEAVLRKRPASNVKRRASNDERPKSHLTSKALRLALDVPLLAACCALLAACTFPGSDPRTVKLGLSAPFEGLYRGLGYQVLPAVRLAVQERNQAGGLGGHYLIELVALNDFNEPQEAARQAAELGADPGVLAVLGGWSPDTARSAAPEYERLGVPFLAPPVPARHTAEAVLRWAGQPDWTRLGEEAAGVAPHRFGLRRAIVVAGPAEYRFCGGEPDASLAQAFAAALQTEGGSVLLYASLASEELLRASLAYSDPASDLLFVAAGAPESAAWIARARSAGLVGSIMGGPELGSPLVVDIAGSASDGVLFVSQYPGYATDATFISGYRELASGAAPGPVAAWAYAAARRLLDAMDAAIRSERQPTRAAVERALRTSRPPSAVAAQPTEEPHVFVYVIRDGNVFNPY